MLPSAAGRSEVITYTITSMQGAKVKVVRGKDAAERYIRTLIKQGVSYSVEQGKPSLRWVAWP